MGYYWAIKRSKIVPFSVSWMDLESVIQSEVSQKEENKHHSSVQFSSVAQSSPTLCNPMSIESVMPSTHLILCCPLLLPSIFPSIRVFSNESALRIRGPKYWNFSFNISPSNEHQDWSPLEWAGWISLQSKGLSRVFSNTTVQKHQFFNPQPSSQSNSHIHTWPLGKP